MPTSAEMDQMCERSIGKLDAEAALDHIASLIDASLDSKYRRGVERALYLLDELARRELTPKQGALIEYFRANAWGAKEELAGERGSWDWEHVELPIHTFDNLD